MRLYPSDKSAQTVEEHGHDLELNSENHFAGMKKFLKEHSDAYAKAFADEHIGEIEEPH